MYPPFQYYAPYALCVGFVSHEFLERDPARRSLLCKEVFNHIIFNRREFAVYGVDEAGGF